MSIMPHSPPNPPRQPKIRSSCDGCGAVKARCDRQHPECGRCMSNGITCVYGISRKIGKPRRDRTLNVGNTSNGNSNNKGITNTGTNTPSTTSENSNTNTTTSAGPSASTISTSPIASTSTSSLDSIMSYTRDNNNNNSSNNNDNDHIISMDYGFSDDMSGSTLNWNSFPSLVFGDWMVPDKYEKLDLSGHDYFVGQRRADILIGGGKDHDCHREAHELLGTSLFTGPASNAITDSNSETAVSPFDSGNGVALDQVLLLNRKATERLTALLACPCAASPYMMMLYATLISAILTRCERAASCSSTWNPLLTPGGSVAPARISIGAFSVDDPRVQSALNIQLLAGELRTVVGLIDTIASYECNNKIMREQTGGTNAPRLYQSLAMWLRDEHSRVSGIIGNRLRDLNT